MRTTLNLDDELMRQAKKAAAESGRTLTAVIEDSLRQSLATRHLSEDSPFDLVTSPGSIRPGVDLDDSASLLDVLEGDVPA